jgi:hypothetical protein
MAISCSSLSASTIFIDIYKKSLLAQTSFDGRMIYGGPSSVNFLFPFPSFLPKKN